MLSALLFGPVLWMVFHLRPPTDAAQAGSLVRLGFTISALAWIAQLALVAGVAPAVRSLEHGRPLSQLRAFTAGIVNLVRMMLPCLLAVAAIGLGSLAVVLPGLGLLVLLSLTGASTEPGLPAPLVDSLATVRANLRSVVIVIAVMLAVDLAIPFVAQLVAASALPKKPSADQLATYRRVPQLIVATLAIMSPVLASMLAAIRARADRA